MKELLFKELIIFISALINCLLCKWLGGPIDFIHIVILYWAIRIWVEMVWKRFYD